MFASQGTILEKFLTVPPADFSKLLRSTPISEATVAELQKDREAYRYAQVSPPRIFLPTSYTDSDITSYVFRARTLSCAPSWTATTCAYLGLVCSI